MVRVIRKGNILIGACPAAEASVDLTSWLTVAAELGCATRTETDCLEPNVVLFGGSRKASQESKGGFVCGSRHSLQRVSKTTYIGAGC